MLTITFDPAFDQGFWPGPLDGRKAVTGEMWNGPLGLLDLLETMTGLRGPGLPPVLRAASLVPELRSKEGFWSASAEVDPLGTAAKILEWRDFLKMHGWQGQECSIRLRQLAQVTKDVLPGIPDRLLAVEQSLSSASNALTSLTLLQPIHELPLRWQQVMHGLEQTGTSLAAQELAPAKAQGDLAASRQSQFQPQLDGSLQLLRPQTQLEAAQETAAWLSGLDSLERTVIIGPDSILDEALYRFGLPTTGASQPVYDNALLQILPLVLEMAWKPPDPQRALELLTLPVSPIPKSIALRLVRALQEYPAVGSEKWQELMHEGLQSIENPERRINVQSRLQAIFESSISGSTCPASKILARIDLLRSWAKGRNEANAEELDWQSLISQLENARRLVDVSGLERFTAPQIKRMVHDLTRESGQVPLFPHQAGLERVGSPECLAGKARHVLWWSFNQETAQAVFVDPFSLAEKEALAQTGVELPDPGKQAERNARRWKRPLMLAQSTLLLVCPENSPAGEEQYPHPLWDELTGKMVNNSRAVSLQNREVVSPAKPEQKKRKPVALPRPEPFWRIEKPELLTKRSRESASSLSSLLSCPLQWVINYQGRLLTGLTASLSEPEELEGWFVHEIVARVLEICRQEPQKIPAAVDEAGRIFDEQGPTLAARFFLPGFDHLRARVRNTVQEAVRQLLQIIEQAGFGIESVEQPYSRPIPDSEYTLEGTPDLVLNPPLAVLDLKRGGLKFRQGEIENGASVQLAVYGRLLVKDKNRPFPPAGYFMLGPGQLITACPRVFPGAMHIEGPPLKETWNAITQGYISTWDELARGEIRAPGNEEEPLNESAIVDGRLYLAPCSFCGLGNLCGQAFAEE